MFLEFGESGEEIEVFGSECFDIFDGDFGIEFDEVFLVLLSCMCNCFLVFSDFLVICMVCGVVGVWGLELEL